MESNMKVINLDKTETCTFSHDFPIMAFAYVWAERNNRISQFSTNLDKLLEVMPSIRIGDYGFHLESWSIPFSSLDEDELAGQIDAVSNHNAIYAIAA